MKVLLVASIIFALLVCAELYSMRGLINSLHDKLDNHIRKAERALQSKHREDELKEALMDMIELNIELHTTEEQAHRISDALQKVGGE